MQHWALVGSKGGKGGAKGGTKLGDSSGFEELPPVFGGGMCVRILRPMLLVVLLGGCRFGMPSRKAGQTGSPSSAQVKDHTLQAAVEQLRVAVHRRDAEGVARWMSSDFGYRWDAPPVEENVFEYWARNDLWPELEAILEERLVVKGEYMVGPPAFANDPSYRGYRVGFRTEDGQWKFAYFVSAEGN
jgi:hypothetical protein